MIGVITGLPGAGKTLWALYWIKAKAEKEGREVFYSGIADLKLPWTEIDPEKWMECPPNSIVVIDEAQRVFRPRSHGSNVPKYVSDLETHRHLGIDVFLITQHPMLIESNVRRLGGMHFHVVRKWGGQAATVHEWGQVKEACDKQRDDSVRHKFAYPREVFGYYKSAEVHTHKRRIPYHVLLVAAVPFAVGYAGWRVYTNWFPSARAAEAPLQMVHGANATGAGRSASGEGGPLTVAEYVAQHKPRIASLPHTAPMYDEVIKPATAPYPAACVASSAGWCKCWTQQATAMEVHAQVCEDIARRGFFVSWKQEDSRQAHASPGYPEPRQGAAPDPISIGSKYGNGPGPSLPVSVLSK